MTHMLKYPKTFVNTFNTNTLKNIRDYRNNVGFREKKLLSIAVCFSVPMLSLKKAFWNKDIVKLHVIIFITMQTSAMQSMICLEVIRMGPLSPAGTAILLPYNGNHLLNKYQIQEVEVIILNILRPKQGILY